MIKKFLCLLTVSLSLFTLAAQSDDDLFGGDFNEDALFGGDDDFFTDDGIDEVEDVTAASDLSKGILFQDGSIKIGGNFKTSLETGTVLYADEDKSFADHLYETDLIPTASATLTVDARPTQELRMYSKFGFAYPFETSAISSAGAGGKINTTVSDWFNLKEMFTDFSIADRAYFRFGLHTVTWGTGYFFSPVSDIINTSSINPEDPEAQVNGSLNLRTQITFSGSQNCLWFYVVPSTDFTVGAQTYARDTALAGKADIVLGGWEFGVGGYYKYQNAPKVMLSATGSLKKMSLFAEGVYQYGADSEWQTKNNWADKINIFQATAGFSYFWKDPSITLAAQYYYDGNKKDMTHQYFTYGHNIAIMTNFGRIFGTTDVTATIFGMVNFGKEDMPVMMQNILSSYGIASYLNTATFSAMLNYNPIKTLTIGMGPYITFADWEKAPVVALKVNFTLGGGNF